MVIVKYRDDSSTDLKEYIYNRLRNEGHDIKVVANEHTHAVEIIPKKAGMGAVLKRISSCTKVPLTNFFAIGDSGNDIEMFEVCGYPCTFYTAPLEIIEVVGKREGYMTGYSGHKDTGHPSSYLPGNKEVNTMGLYPLKALEEVYKEVREVIEREKTPTIGVSGQAGAGKTTFVKEFCEYLSNKHSLDSQIMNFDYFFKLSSKERKKWIDDGMSVGGDEYLRRSNNLEWFDFPKFYTALEQLKQQKRVILDKVYDKHTGELIKTVNLDPDRITLVDGVFILHCPLLDTKVYIHRDPDERRKNIEKRDGHRKSKEALDRRWIETQGTEIPYLERTLKNADVIVDASKGYKIFSEENITQQLLQEIIERSKDEKYDPKWEPYVETSLRKLGVIQRIIEYG